MSAYKDALQIDGSSSEELLTMAAQLLTGSKGVVLLEQAVALRSTPYAILCEVIDRAPDAHRCAEEFKVLIENAGRALATSRLAALLPAKPLRWSVVQDCGVETVELWPGDE